MKQPARAEVIAFAPRRGLQPRRQQLPARNRNAPDDRPDAPLRSGLTVIAAFFGLFGALAALLPMNAAVLAPGAVTVDGSRKSIQHLDGGIVREIKVKEGARVAAGETLIVLDDTQARSEFAIARQLYTTLKMSEARLAAELAGTSPPVFPSELANLREEADIAALWRAQLEQHARRGTALSGRGGIISEKIAQLEAQAAGSLAQRASLEAQIRSVRDELQSLKPLLERGLVTKPRVLQLERSEAQLEGQLGEIEGTIAHQKQAIAEQRAQSAQVGKERFSDVAQELADARAKIAEALPRLVAARAALDRTRVVSPYAGRVVALAVVSVGGVVARGERLMDIVPEAEALVVEARIPVEEIAEIHAGMAANVRLTAYKQRTTPLVSGSVTQISADRLTDARTNAPYYLVLVQVTPGELASLQSVQLYPGMPATVLIPTEQRTALQYLLSPLSSVFGTAFHER